MSVGNACWGHRNRSELERRMRVGRLRCGVLLGDPGSQHDQSEMMLGWQMSWLRFVPRSVRESLHVWLEEVRYLSEG